MSQEHAIPDTQNTLQKFPLACELSYGPGRAAVNRMVATKRSVAIWGSQSVTVGPLFCYFWWIIMRRATVTCHPVTPLEVGSCAIDGMANTWNRNGSNEQNGGGHLE